MEPDKAIKTWMVNVLQETGMSATEWARKAGVAPTTLTRFLGKRKTLADNDEPFVTSTKSLCKLIAVVGSAPDFLSESLIYRVKMEDDYMTRAGILPGDLLTINPALEMKTNAVVAFRVGGKVSAGRYYPEHFMPDSSNTRHEPLLTSDVEILGVVVEASKQMAP